MFFVRSLAVVWLLLCALVLFLLLSPVVLVAVAVLAVVACLTIVGLMPLAFAGAFNAALKRKARELVSWTEARRARLSRQGGPEPPETPESA